jgi:hypothetical protein
MHNRIVTGPFHCLSAFGGRLSAFGRAVSAAVIAAGVLAGPVMTANASSVDQAASIDADLRYANSLSNAFEHAASRSRPLWSTSPPRH